MPNGVGIVQAYVEGRVLNVNGVARDGEVIAEVHEEALRTWPADCGPVSYAQTIAPEARARSEQARALIAALEWSGIFNLQFIEAEAGLFLVDVNPRLYTSIGLAVAAGANLPAIWVESLLGGRPEVAPYRVGVQFRSEADVRSLTHLFRSGARGAALAGLLPQRHTTHAIASISDPRPGCPTCARLPGRLMPTDGVLARARPLGADRLEAVGLGQLRVLRRELLGQVDHHAALLPGGVVLHLAVDHVHAAAVRDRLDHLLGEGDLVGVGENTRLAISIWAGCSDQAPTQPSRNAARNCASHPAVSRMSP